MRYIENIDKSKPKYKIGDIVVYISKIPPYGTVEYTEVEQSKIIDAKGEIDIEDKNDTVGWLYLIEKLQPKWVTADRILYKLKN
jgi:hypothetical protein